MRARLAVLTLVVAILALGLVAAGCSSEETTSSGGTGAATTATYETVDVQTAYDALSADENAQLVDVREPEEWAETGVGPEAVLIPLGDVEAQAPSELTADQPVYVDLPDRQPQPDRLGDPGRPRLHAGVQRGRRHHGVGGFRAPRGGVHALTRAATRRPAPGRR